MAGQPTKLVVKYIYRPKAQLGLAGGGRSTYRRYYGKGGASGLSVEVHASIADTDLAANTIRKLKAMKPNRARTATLWVNLPCIAVSSINLPWVFPRYPTYPTPAMVAGWGECMPAIVDITLHVGKLGRIGNLSGVQDSELSLYDIYVRSAPVQATTPTPPTGPTGDPTGPTGPSDPTGPTGPTG